MEKVTTFTSFLIAPNARWRWSLKLSSFGMNVKNNTKSPFDLNPFLRGKCCWKHLHEGKSKFTFLNLMFIVLGRARSPAEARVKGEAGQQQSHRQMRKLGQRERKGWKMGSSMTTVGRIWMWTSRPRNEPNSFLRMTGLLIGMAPMTMEKTWTWRNQPRNQPNSMTNIVR